MNLNQTQNYQLSQWESTDRILMSDFNSDNAKLDAALSTLAQTRNCRVYQTTYSGDGQKSRTYTFPSRPMLVNFMGYNHWACAVQGTSTAGGRFWGGDGSQKMSASWSGNSVTITCPNTDTSYMCNMSGHTYSLVALLEVD